MAFQGDGFQNNAFQKAAGPTNNPPGRNEVEPYAPNQLYPWQPQWWLIQRTPLRVPDPPANPPFPGATALALVNSGVLASWIPPARGAYEGNAPKVLPQSPFIRNLTIFNSFANWNAFNVTVTANAATSPDGFVDAGSIFETVTNSFHEVSLAVPKASATSLTYTLSVYFKNISSARQMLVTLADDALANGATYTFNLSDGSFVQQSTFGTGFTLISAGLANKGGWYRVFITCSTNSDTYVRTRFQVLAAGATNFVGDVTQGFLLWGPRVIEGADDNDLYLPTPAFAMSSWPGGDPNLQGNNLRVLIAPALMQGVRATKIALGLQFRNTTSNGNIDSIWVGHQGSGNAYNFDGNQVQLTFRGANSIALINDPDTGENLTTDFVNFNFDSTKPLIVAVHFSGTKVDVKATFGGAFGAPTAIYLLSAADSSAQTAPAGSFTAFAGELDLVADVDLLGVTISPLFGATALALVSLLVATDWRAPDPVQQPRPGIAALLPPPPPAGGYGSLAPWVGGAFTPSAATSLTGASVPQAVLNSWLPPDPGPTMDVGTQPYAPSRLEPPFSGPPPQNPPFAGGAQIPSGELNWYAPDPTLVLPPLAARNMEPKLLVSDPPFAGGARVPNEVLVGWIPPPPDPFMGMGGGNLQPLEQTKVPFPSIANYPPPSSVYTVRKEVLIAWLPPDPQPIVGPIVIERTVANYPPPSSVYQTPLPVLINWIPPDPAPIVGPKLTPPSNPVTQPLRGAFVSKEVLVSWLPPDPLPILPPLIIERTIANYPPPSPVYQTPLAVQLSWQVPDPIQVPRATLPPQPPPVVTFLTVGEVVPQAVLVSWIPGPPDPIMGMGRVGPLEGTKLAPPQSGPTPQNPPVKGSEVPQEVLVSWLPPDPMPIVAQKAIESAWANYPPPSRAHEVPLPVLLSWLFPDPQPIVGPKAIEAAWANYPPTSGVYGVPLPVLLSWLPPDPAPIVGPKLVQPVPPVTFVTVGAVVPPPVLVSWIPGPPDPIMGMGRVGTLEATKLAPPQSGPTPQNPPFPGTKVSTEVQVSWLPAPPQPIVGQQLYQAAPAAFQYLPPRQPGTVEIAVNWLPAPPQPVTGQRLFLSGPAFVPPAYRATVEIQVSWLPAPPQPIVAGPLNPFLMTSVPVPHRMPGLVEVLVTWLPPDPAFQVGARLTPPSNPVPAPLAGSVVPPAVRVWWETPPPPRPPTGQIQPFQTPPPVQGAVTVPYPVRSWWDLPPPAPIVARNLQPPISGPTPQNPQFAGGAAVPRQVLVWWIPPDPQPQVTTYVPPQIPPPPPAGYGSLAFWVGGAFSLPPPAGYGSLAFWVGGAFSPPRILPPPRLDPRFITWPPARVQVTFTPLLRERLTVPLSRLPAVVSTRSSITCPNRRNTVTIPILGTQSMPRGNDFSPIDPTETVTNTFDFGPWLSAGVTLSNPTVTCTVISGADSGAAGRLIGSPLVTTSPTNKRPSQAVLQQVSTMVAGVTYELTCTVLTSDSQTLTLYAHQPCQAQT